jgi:hypothetical protein
MNTPRQELIRSDWNFGLPFGAVVAEHRERPITASEYPDQARFLRVPRRKGQFALAGAPSRRLCRAFVRIAHPRIVPVNQMRRGVWDCDMRDLLTPL